MSEAGDLLRRAIDDAAIARAMQQYADICAALRALGLDPSDGLPAVARGIEERFGAGAYLTLITDTPGTLDGNMRVAVTRDGEVIWEGGG